MLTAIPRILSKMLLNAILKYFLESSMFKVLLLFGRHPMPHVISPTSAD